MEILLTIEVLEKPPESLQIDLESIKTQLDYSYCKISIGP